MPSLSIQQLHARHVGPINLDVAAGECVTIQGDSGSGKSLLLRAIADLDAHDGEVLLDDFACSLTPPAEWRREVALVMAESAWWFDRVGEHFAQGIDARWLDRLGLPKAAMAWEVARCSTGERQRLSLLRSLMRRPSVLLLDEPTGNLDANSTTGVEALLADYRQERAAAVIWVSHDQQQAARVAQRAFLLADGQLHAREWPCQ